MKQERKMSGFEMRKVIFRSEVSRLPKQKLLQWLEENVRSVSLEC